MVEKLIVKRAEARVRQSLFGGFILVAALLMVMNSFGFIGWIQAATQTTADVAFNITGGSFALDNGPTQINFADQSYGTSGNFAGDSPVSNLQVTDYRGNAASWDVAASAANLSDGTNEIDADRMTLYTTSATLYNVENSTTTFTAVGATGTLNDTGMTLLNGSTQASGIIQFDAGSVSLEVWATDLAGTYTTTVYFTLT